MTDLGNMPVSSLMHHDDFELYHYGVKGMKWGHVKQKFHTGFMNWRKQRTTNAADQLQRRGNSKGKAIAVATAKGVGGAVAVSAGTRLAAKLLSLTGSKALGAISKATVVAGDAAAVAILANKGVEIYDIAKTDVRRR